MLKGYDMFRMSALGQKRYIMSATPMSALLSRCRSAKADSGRPDVRFTPKSGHVQCTSHVRFVPIADIAPEELKRASYEPTSEFMLICN